MKANIEGFEGTIDFNPNTNNEYEVYVIAICDPKTDEVVSEERYTSKEAFNDALDNTDGRDYRNVAYEDGTVYVVADGETFECKATYEIAYVVDTGMSELFQDFELEALLGEFIDDYDYDAIVEEVTVVNYKTGNRHWKDIDDDEMNEILERHDKKLNV